MYIIMTTGDDLRAFQSANPYWRVLTNLDGTPTEYAVLADVEQAISEIARGDEHASFRVFEIAKELNVDVSYRAPIVEVK